MTDKEKIAQIRKLLEIPRGMRICQQLWNQLEAHDYGDMFYMPDDVLIHIIKDKPDFSQIYRKVRMK